ncbi:hypothetical protein [Agarilytica rhodophyticola]|uniref:hypothetical protein n=1 Tax=Agarilytica rhodophyticola TaxID=1737490 RepID=UPI000B34595D|nr:hypothetical protein [Agarilytica rhodophyticola]
MKLEKAFSEDVKLNITARQADMKFAEGVIQSKFNFQCPGKNCDAPVTCANLDRPLEKRKRDPYYIIVGEHSSQCNIAKDIDNQKKASKTTMDIYKDSDEYIDHAIRINLQPPSTKRLESGDLAKNSEYSESRISRGRVIAGKRKIQRTKTLSSLIDAYLAKESLIVQLPETGLIDLNNLFIEINGQNLADFEDEFRIYYGKAWFNKKEHGYSIVFDKTLTSGDIIKRPSTYIPISKLEVSGFKRFNLDTLERTADNKPKMVFLISETGPRVKDGHINIWCESPEYLDYRLLEK